MDIELAAQLAAILAGSSVLVVSFAVSQAAVRAERASRLNFFVRRNSYVAQPTVKRPRQEVQAAVVERMNKRLRGASFARELQWQIIRAGVDMPASRFLVLQALAAGFGFLLLYVFSLRFVDPGYEQLGYSALGAAGGWWAPRRVLRLKEGRRLKKFESQLPNTVDAMAGSLQAGSSLPQAMEMVGREMPAPIGEEFAIVVREIAVGVPMQEAFDNMLDRVRSLDLDMLLTAINIQYRVGGNLSQILRSIAHTVRERLRIRGEIAVLTAQQRISAYVVSLLPVGIVLVLLLISPAYISKLFLPGITRVLLIMALLGIGLGFYAMKKIADIDV